MNTVSVLSFINTTRATRENRSRNASSRLAMPLRVVAASVLFLVLPQAWAQDSGVIAFDGAVATPTAGADDTGRIVTNDEVPPHRTDVTPLDGIARPRAETLDYLVQGYRDAGIASSRLRLMTLDYL